MAKQKTSRIILDYRGKHHPFVNFWVDRNDNSFYFHVYRKQGETPMSSTDTSNEEGNLRIHFPSFKPTGFDENKISFHKSGYVHSTDKFGKRYRDGVRGVEFQHIDSFLFILAIAPKNPADMGEIKTIDTARDIQIHLKEDASPFSVQFAIVKKGTKTLPQISQEENMLGDGVILVDYDNEQFGLVIAIVKVLKGAGMTDVAWPPFPVVLKRIG